MPTRRRAAGAQAPAVESRDAPGSPAKRWKRPNVWLGKVIPLSLLVFAVSGYSLVVTEIIPLLYRRRPPVALAYALIVHVTLALTAYSYFAVYLQSLDPPRNKDPPREVQDKRVIFACDEVGEPVRCDRDKCGGAWQSLRTRHCRDCGTCRPGFDHHCAFMDSCVCTATLKPFCCFLLYAAVLLAVGLVPLTPLQWRACREVVSETWWSDEMRRDWWDGWKGWIGGPVYRYAGALLLGYRQYQRTAHKRPLIIPDVHVRTFQEGALTYAYDEPLFPRLAIPHLSTLFISFFAAFITVIALVMLAVVVRHARDGVSSVQLERLKLWRAQDPLEPVYDARIRLWVPLPIDEVPAGGAVVLVEPDVPLFDLGAAENWRKMMGRKWWQWFQPWVPSEFSDFDMSPTAVKLLEQRARKQL
ncbi:uncharacterized protein JCM10292_000146 [Rhodotorula paludigena]|uniref:uncharacterized protein n=1 Tax=Rhodotorula paludigena TaxID=86838 RepID=UPI00316D101F